MYFEYQNAGRENLKFTYKCEDLIEPARRKLDEFSFNELKCRNALADLLRDPNVSQSDKRISDLRKEIESNGRQAEACRVFTHEFIRNPTREVHLTLGDVVFFDYPGGE